MKCKSLITVVFSLALTLILTLAMAIVPTAGASANQVAKALSMDREELAGKLLEVFTKTLSEEEFQSLEVDISLKSEPTDGSASLRTMSTDGSASLRTMRCGCSSIPYTTRASDPCSRWGQCWVCQ